MGLDLDGKDVEDGEHFPSQENHRNDSYGDGQYLAKLKVAAARLEASRDQAQNIQGCKAKHQHPEDVVDVVLFAVELIGQVKVGKLKHAEQQRLQGHNARPQQAA